MLTNEQTTEFTAAALGFIILNPLAGQQALREHLAGLIGGERAYEYATDIILQDLVLSAQRAAYSKADQAAKDANDAQIHADWVARMAVPVPAAPVYETAPASPVVLTHQDHIEAIKTAYGEDFNLQAACRYALYNGIGADDVANTTGRPVGECQGLMYPG